jgi:integrase
MGSQWAELNVHYGILAQTEASSMAGKPTRHGNGWRVRWTDPRDKAAWSFPVVDAAEGKALSAWIDSKHNQVRPTDDELKYHTWRTGEAPRKVSSHTFGTWSEKVIKNRKLKADTERDHLNGLKNHFSDWTDVPIDQVTRKMLEAKIVDLSVRPSVGNGVTGGLSARTQAGLIVLVAGILRDAEGAELIKRSPFRADPLNALPAIPVPSVVSVPRLRTSAQMLIPLPEWQKMMAAAAALDARMEDWRTPADRHLALFMWVMAETGCRISEIHALWIENVLADNVDDAYVFVEFAFQYENNVKTRGRVKGGTQRTIPITPDLAAALRKFIGGRDSSEYLFPAPRDADGWSYLPWWRQRWTKMVKLAVREFGLSPTLRPQPHMTRHMHVSHLRNAGAATLDVRRNTGHKSESTTDGYSHADPEQAARIKAKMPDYGPLILPD